MKPIENVQYWRPDNLKGIETCQVIGSSHAFPNHSHENIYAIGLMEKGDCYCVGPGKTQRLMETGEISLINPGQVHSGVPRHDTTMTYRMFYLDVAVMCEFARDIFEDTTIVPEFSRFVIRDTRLFSLFSRLVDLLECHREKMELESVIIEALSSLLSCYGNLTKKQHRIYHHRAVNRAKEFLSANLCDRITLEQVSKEVGLSRYHFLRVFKQKTGLSPHVYRTQCRIEASKHLLKQGIPLADIAFETGFSDQSHFNNKFRQFTGATPIQYLANVYQ